MTANGNGKSPELARVLEIIDSRLTQIEAQIGRTNLPAHDECAKLIRKIKSKA